MTDPIPALPLAGDEPAAGPLAAPDTAPDAARDERAPRGIQSVEVGGALLIALTQHGRPLPLKALALAAGMTPAKAHPYLVSFQKVGLVEQESEGGRYGLGPLALQMGLIGLQQYDPVRLATPMIEALAQETGHTLAIAVWGNRGPTLVRIAEAPSPVHVSMRHGTVMSMRGTASGLLFAAYMPREEVLQALAMEHAMGAGSSPEIDAAMDAVLARTREHGIAWVEGKAVAGVSAMAAPVFDDRGRITASLTAIGPSSIFDCAVDGPVGRPLLASARELSARLGWRPDA